MRKKVMATAVTLTVAAGLLAASQAEAMTQIGPTSCTINAYKPYYGGTTATGQASTICTAGNEGTIEVQSCIQYKSGASWYTISGSCTPVNCYTEGCAPNSGGPYSVTTYATTYASCGTWYRTWGWGWVAYGGGYQAQEVSNASYRC